MLFINITSNSTFQLREQLQNLVGLSCKYSNIFLRRLPGGAASVLLSLSCWTCLALTSSPVWHWLALRETETAELTLSAQLNTANYENTTTRTVSPHTFIIKWKGSSIKLLQLRTSHWLRY